MLTKVRRNWRGTTPTSPRKPAVTLSTSASMVALGKRRSASSGGRSGWRAQAHSHLDRAPEPAAAPTQPVPTQPQASPSAEVSSPAAVAELRLELGALPDSVLVGTDVVPLADYLVSVVPIPPSGTFLSEQGGATAEVRIMPGAQGVSLTRQFSEPGTQAQTKRYDGLQARAHGVRLSSASLQVLGTRQSMLVLEALRRRRNSGFALD